MGKESRARVLQDHQAMAIGRNIRVSPRKLNLVAQSIRGKRVDRALNELSFSPKRIAKDVKKILQSAIANAENNHDLDVDDLVVREASVGKNLVMKRFHARARGNSGRRSPSGTCRRTPAGRRALAPGTSGTSPGRSLFSRLTRRRPRRCPAFQIRWIFPPPAPPRRA